jgi:hypothetical protein
LKGESQIDTQFAKPQLASPRPCSILGIRGTAAAVYIHKLLTNLHVLSLNKKKCNNIRRKIQILKNAAKRCSRIKLIEAIKLVSNGISKCGSFAVETADFFTHVYKLKTLMHKTSALFFFPKTCLSVISHLASRLNHTMHW